MGVLRIDVVRLTNVIRITTKMASFVAHVPPFHEFYENQLSSFCLSLLTNKLTNALKTISLAQVISYRPN